MRFVERNRVIAALTPGTLVVEAAVRSGALITAHRADALGRVVMGVPGPITSPQSAGVHQLLREEETYVVTSAAEVLEHLGRIGDDLAPRKAGPARPWDRLPPDLLRVLEAVSPFRPLPPPAIARAAGIAPGAVTTYLEALRELGLTTTRDALPGPTRLWLRVTPPDANTPDRAGALPRNGPESEAM
ncbi:DNA-processing protein DprA [Yinghuangia aomiensis]